MKIRFLANTNIRVSPKDFSKPIVGVVFAGVELEVEDKLYRGIPIEGIDTYFKDHRGWYYWSGRIVIIYKALEAPKSEKKKQETEGEFVGGSWQLPLSEHQSKREAGQVADQTINTEDTPKSTEKESISEATPRQNNHLKDLININTAKLHWGLEKQNIPNEFWQEKGLFGKGIKVALLGSEVDENHPDLMGKIVQNHNFSGKVSSDETIKKIGTHCALLIAGSGNNQITGIAPGVKLMVGKIMDSYLNYDFDHFIEAFGWAISEQADIIFTNIEFKDTSLTKIQKQQLTVLFNEASERGIFCIAPAGRSKNMRPEYRYPAALATCLSVGEYRANGDRASNTIRSYALDVMSPVIDAKYLMVSGNCEGLGVAAAFATGGVALLLEWITNNQATITPGQLIQMLKETAEAKYPSIKCRDIEYGCGYINFSKCLHELEQQM